MDMRHPFWARSDSVCSKWRNLCIQRTALSSFWGHFWLTCCSDSIGSIQHYLNYDDDCLIDASGGGMDVGAEQGAH